MSYVAALRLYRIKLGTKLIRSLRPLWLGQGGSFDNGAIIIHTASVLAFERIALTMGARGGVRTCSPFEGGILHSWKGGLGAHPGVGSENGETWAACSATPNSRGT